MCGVLESYKDVYLFAIEAALSLLNVGIQPSRNAPPCQHLAERTVQAVCCIEGENICNLQGIN